jgi:hypothetical protein
MSGGQFGDGGEADAGDTEVVLSELDPNGEGTRVRWLSIRAGRVTASGDCSRGLRGSSFGALGEKFAPREKSKSLQPRSSTLRSGRSGSDRSGYS